MALSASTQNLFKEGLICLSLAAITVAVSVYNTESADAAYSKPVTWEDMSAMDLRPAFRSQYASPDNLMDPVIGPSEMDLVMRDADAHISQDFKIPETLKPAVGFWLKVYTQYTTQHVVIFDSHHPEMIYGVLDFRELARTARNRVAYEIISKGRIKRALAAYRKALDHLARNPNPKNPTLEETAVMNAVKTLPHKHSYAELRQQVRAQAGQRDNIIKGLLAAETFFPKMEQIFTKMGVPIELTRLTLVESSFNLRATSRVGASGVWQFMPKSGKEFLTVDNAIDERASPLKATVAAAKLLRRNYGILGHWALAVTSYNHGLSGLPHLHEDDAELKHIGHLFDSCSKNRRKHLAWAGRNYYAEYLAVLHAEAYRNLFYGEPPKAQIQPVAFERSKPGKTGIQVALEHGVPLQMFRLYNPDIRNIHAILPHGFVVAIPGENDDLALLTEPKHRRPRVASNF